MTGGAGALPWPGGLRSLDPVSHPKAICTDGSRANFMPQEGRHSGRVMIWLEGGGGCWSQQTCRDRCREEPYLCTAQTETGGRRPAREARDDSDQYSEYWQVFIHYCSSDLWSGTRAASSATFGNNFQGRNIFDAVLTDLIENFDLLSATELVLSGCSAGASGVLYSCDHLAGRLAGSAAGSGLRCVADAPDYYPADVTGTADCETRQPGFQAATTALWGRQLDQSCLQFAADTGVADPDLLCGAHSTSVPHVSTPLLLATPHFDRVITAIYACEEAVGAEGSPAFNALLSAWSAAHMRDITALTVARPDIAVYAPNCWLHCLTNAYPTMKVTEAQTGQRIGLGPFITKWLAGDGRSPQHANDDIATTNPTCAGLE